ncbi:hypothetical protein LshimejAT787_0405650 [Lyophyllum shimeji]|uniref:Uncharacterized protein n=1 Tax=Lyophyllum shimeji TaxID=47721 RepID=A0A9P3PLB6_LYOSH|nr:hypothetical protein LshimejAT787_0405650 [Lyophyllum shimeji]
MSDYDEYFADDILLDDQTLAVLDQEEQKYLSQAVNPAPPPAKRQKTDDGWTVGIGSQAAPVRVTDCLPEISLTLDGSYGVLGNASMPPAPSGIPPKPQSAKNGPAAGTRFDQLPAPALVLPSVTVQRVPAPVTSRNTTTTSFQHRSRSRPPSNSQSRPPTVQRPNSRGHTVQALAENRAHLTPPPWLPSPPVRGSNHVDRPHELEIQLEELKQKLAQVSKENQEMQAALQEAMTVRMAKEGEVTVLRKYAEKVAQEHAAQLAKLKAAREEAEAKQVRMQKEMRDEVERLKTQFLFKESARKPPPSTRPKKSSKEPPSIFISTPSQPRWPIHQDASSTAQAHVDEMSTAGPSHGNLREVRKSPQVKRAYILPGFQNTFNDTTPLRASQRRQGKGKQSAVESVPMYEPPSGHHYAEPVSPVSPLRRMQSANGEVNMNSLVKDTFTESAHVPDADGDVDMTSGTAEDGNGISVEEDHDADEVYSIEPPDWKGELNRMVLMHCLPACTTLTIQMLLGAPVSSELGEGLWETYLGSCTRMLEVIANTTQSGDWRYTVERVSQSLVTMVPVLRAANAFLPLATLFNMMAVLIYSLPDFGSVILSQPFDTQTADCRVLVFLCGIILDQREIEKQPSHETLATEVVTLLEALSFTVDSELVDKLAYIPRHRQVLMYLFRGNQPSSLLARSARLLVVLASHRKLCRFLISMPDPDLPPEEKTAEPQKIPIIERLCLYLMDCNRKDAEYKDAKTSILTFFTLLSISQPDVHAHLVTSTTVIPSLVFFITQLTTAFWEDDEELLAATSEEVSLAIRTLNQTVFLLHHLVFTSVPFLNLRQKLHAPYHRLFHGLLHMFIVTFGRLSYGEAPEWIDRQGRIDLVSSTDMARDLLDHVVDGPEADRTWQAYQIDGEGSNETDEEEMEEQLLGERI